jgi:hypothetical protein
MLTQPDGVCDLRAVAADFLRPLHKTLLNGTLSCTLNNQFVTEFINNPLAVPRSLRSTGDFNECEYTREPDHILVSSPWHAYIPVDASYPPKDIKAWIFQDTVLPLETFAPTYRRSGRVTSGFLKKVQTAVDHARSLLTMVYNVYGPPTDPLSLDYVSLQNFHGSYEELCTEVWAIRRSVLVVYGYITYCLVTDPKGWKDNSSISAEFIDAMESSGLLGLPRRGLIIDAQNPPSFKDVVSYLHHSVPVHYYWQTNCVHWLDPTATQSVDLQQNVTPPRKYLVDVLFLSLISLQSLRNLPLRTAFGDWVDFLPSTASDTRNAFLSLKMTMSPVRRSVINRP